MSLSKIRTLELTSFISDELKEAAKISSSDLLKIVNELSDCNKQFSNGIYIRRANPLTVNIRENSAMISRIFSAMRAMIKVELLSPFAEHADEAKAVRPFLKSYASVFSRGSLRQKIEHAEKFVQEANSSKFKSKIKELKLDELLMKFDQLRKSLAADFAERGDEITPNNKVDMKTLRKKIIHRYGMMMHYMEFLQHFAPSQELEDFIARHNNRITELMSIVNLRSTSFTKREKFKQLRLREMALKMGWQIPLGEKDFKYQGSLRILHPTENVWYRLGHREGKLALVKMDQKSCTCRRPSRDNLIDLSSVKKSQKGASKPADFSKQSNEKSQPTSTEPTGTSAENPSAGGEKAPSIPTVPADTNLEKNDSSSENGF